jgi:hypothetical protein
MTTIAGFKPLSDSTYQPLRCQTLQISPTTALSGLRFCPAITPRAIEDGTHHHRITSTPVLQTTQFILERVTAVEIGGGYVMREGEDQGQRGEGVILLGGKVRFRSRVGKRKIWGDVLALRAAGMKAFS